MKPQINADKIKRKADTRPTNHDPRLSGAARAAKRNKGGNQPITGAKLRPFVYGHQRRAAVAELALIPDRSILGAMKIATGKVVGGKVIVEGVTLEE
ncbi:MAG: hypothetical protein ACREB3_12225, partial [Burkholderiales bacterium]